MIDGVYDLFHDPELLSNVIRGIMIELKSNPQYMKHVVKTDARTWVRAMRDNMGLARIKKQEKKTKTASRSKSKATDADLMSALDDLNLSFD